MPRMEVHGFDQDIAELWVKAIFKLFATAKIEDGVAEIFPTKVYMVKEGGDELVEAPYLKLESTPGEHLDAAIQALRFLDGVIDFEFGSNLQRFMPAREKLNSQSKPPENLMELRQRQLNVESAHDIQQTLD